MDSSYSKSLQKNLELVRRLISENSYHKIESRGQFDIYIKNRIKERQPNHEESENIYEMFTMVYAIDSSFPYILWLRERSKASQEDKALVESGGYINVFDSLESIINAKAENKVQYLYEEHAGPATEKYFRKALDSLRYQKGEHIRLKPKQAYSQALKQEKKKQGSFKSFLKKLI